MGLTIHYSLNARCSDARARELVRALHQHAQDLPFQELGPVVEMSGKECDYNTPRRKGDPLTWLLIQARETVEIRTKGSTPKSSYITYRDVHPSRVIAFTAWPGEGCEESNFGLCEYPAEVKTGEGMWRTGIAGWGWGSFCKTAYSANSNYGGVPHFLRCHLTVIALLDKAKELHCLGKVHDEGGFWEKRDMQALARMVADSNAMLAAFGGLLKDLAGEGIEMPISEFPDFEKLEALGQDKLPPQLAQLAKLAQQVTPRTRRSTSLQLDTSFKPTIRT